MTPKEVESEARRLMDLAKAKLLKDGVVHPFARFYKKNKPPIYLHLDLSTFESKKAHRVAIRTAIMAGMVDAVIIVSEVWVRSAELTISPEEVEKISNAGIKDDPQRAEALCVMGGCPGGTLTLTQPYRRQGKDFIFEEEWSAPGGENEYFGTAWDMREGKGKTRH